MAFTIKIPTIELPKVSVDINTDLYSAILSDLGADSSKLNFVDYKPGNLPDLLTVDSQRYQALIQQPKPIFDIGDTIQSIFNKRLTELADRGKPISWTTEKLKQLEPTVGNAMFAASQIGAYMTEEEASSLIASGMDQGLTGPGIMQAVIDAVRLKIDDVAAFNSWSELSGGASPGGVAVPTSISSSESAYAPLVNEFAHNYNLDPAVLQAIIMAESGGYAGSHNTAGEDSRGLLNLNFAGGQGSSALQSGQITDPNQAFDPRTNLSIGVPQIAQAYQQGIAQGLQGDALVAFTATHSGHPGLISTSDKRIQNIINFYHTYKTKTYQPSPPPPPPAGPTLTGKLILGENFTAEALRESLNAAGISPDYLNQFNQLGQQQLDATQSMEIVKQAEDMFRQQTKLTPELEAKLTPAFDAVSGYLTSLKDLGQGDKAEIDQALANLQEEQKLLLEPLKPKKMGIIDKLEDFGEMVGGAFHGLPTHVVTDPLGKTLELVHKSPLSGLGGPALMFLAPATGPFAPAVAAAGVGLVLARGMNTLDDWDKVFRSGIISPFIWNLTKPEQMRGYNSEQQALLFKEQVQGTKDLEGRAALGIPEEKDIVPHSVETNPIEWLKRAGDLLTDNPLAGGGAWDDFNHDFAFAGEHPGMAWAQLHPAVNGIAHLVREGVEAEIKTAAWLLTNPLEATPIAKLWPLQYPAAAVGFRDRGIDVWRKWEQVSRSFQEGQKSPTADDLAVAAELAGWVVGFPLLGKAGRAGRTGVSWTLRGTIKNPMVAMADRGWEPANFIVSMFEETHASKAHSFAQRTMAEIMDWSGLRPLRQSIKELMEVPLERLGAEGSIQRRTLELTRGLLSVDRTKITERELAKFRGKWASFMPSQQLSALKRLEKAVPGTIERQAGILNQFITEVLPRGVTDVELRALGESLGLDTGRMLLANAKQKALPYLETLGGRGANRLQAGLGKAGDAWGEQRALNNSLREMYLDALPEFPKGTVWSPFATAFRPESPISTTIANVARSTVDMFPGWQYVMSYFNRYLYGPAISGVLLTPAFALHVAEESLGRMMFYTHHLPKAINPWGEDLPAYALRRGMTEADFGGARHLILGIERPGQMREMTSAATKAEQFAQQIPKSALQTVWTPVGKTIDKFFSAVKRTEAYARVNVWADAFEKSTARQLAEAGMSKDQLQNYLGQRYLPEFEAMFDEAALPATYKEAFLARIAEEPSALFNPTKLEQLVNGMYTPRKIRILNPVTGKREVIDRGEDMILQVFDQPIEGLQQATKIPPRTRWWLAQNIAKPGGAAPENVAKLVAQVPEMIKDELTRYVRSVGDAQYAELMSQAIDFAGKGDLAATMNILGLAERRMDRPIDLAAREIYDLAISEGQTFSYAQEQVRRKITRQVEGSISRAISKLTDSILPLLDRAELADVVPLVKERVGLMRARAGVRTAWVRAEAAEYDARVQMGLPRAQARREATEALRNHPIRNPLTGEKAPIPQVMKAIDDRSLDIERQLVVGLAGPEQQAAIAKMGQTELLTQAKAEMDNIVDHMADRLVQGAQAEWKQYAPKVSAVADALLSPESRAYADRLRGVAEQASARAGVLAADPAATIQVTGEQVPLAGFLSDINSKSRQFASQEVRSMFTEYNRVSDFDNIMRKVFPFWMYETRAPATWFAKIIPENPWMMLLWKKYLDYANSSALPGQPRRFLGLVPMPTSPATKALGLDYLWLDPLRGSFLNRVNRIIRGANYGQFGDGGFGLGNLLNQLQDSAGIYLAPLLSQAIYLTGITGNSWSFEQLPQVVQSLYWPLELATGKRIPAGPFEDYRYNMAEANQASRFRHQLSERVDKGEITSDQADKEWAAWKPNEKVINTQLAAQRIFFAAFPRFKGAEDTELKKNIEVQDNLVKLGIPYTTQKALEAAGKSPYSLLTRQQERTLRKYMMPELEYYGKIGWPFTEKSDPDKALLLRQRDKYFTLTEAKRTAAYQAQGVDDAKLQKYRDEVQAYGMSTSDPSQILDPTQWKDRHHARWNGAGVNDSLAPDETADRFMGVSQYANTLKATLGDIFAKSGKAQVMPIEDIMLSAYYAIQAPIKEGQYNYDAMYSLQDQFLNKVSPSVRTYMESEMSKWQTPMVQEFVQARDVRDQQQAIPRYKYADKPTQELYFSLRSTYDYMVAQGKAAAVQGDFDTFRYWQNRARKFKAQYRILGVTLPPNPAFLEFTYAPDNWELLRDWYELPELPEVIEAEPVLAQ